MLSSSGVVSIHRGGLAYNVENVMMEMMVITFVTTEFEKSTAANVFSDRAKVWKSAAMTFSKAIGKSKGVTAWSMMLVI